MSIYLVQHGKNLPKDQDWDKGLSDEGIAEVKKIAETAKFYGVKVSQIIHSGKTRARQTAQIFASTLDVKGEIEQTDGINPLDDVSEFAGKLRPESNLMVVGHLPFMEKLTAFLATGSDQNPVFKFQNGGIVCLNKNPDDKFWLIQWSLSPHIG